jgi:hypothetical protein
VRRKIDLTLLTGIWQEEEIGLKVPRRMQNQKKLATVGLFLLIPALTLVISGLFRFDVPYLLIHPVLVLGGLVGSMAINLWAVARIYTRLENGNLVSALSIRIRGTLINLCVLAVSLSLLGTIALYLFVENFQPR